MPRLFVAILLPEKLRRRLAQEADRLRLTGAQVAWVNPDNYHLTLRFLGELPDEAQVDLFPILRDAIPGSGGLRLVAKGLGAFPSEGRPRTVWCGVVGEEDLESLELAGISARLDRALRNEGYRRDRSEFRPHITLGRIRSEVGLDALRERMGPAVQREFGHFVAREAVLLESFRGPKGQEYHPVRRFPL